MSSSLTSGVLIATLEVGFFLWGYIFGKNSNDNKRK